MDGRSTALILAAGGLLLQQPEPEVIEVAIVHRPGREDWTFPKGKVEPKETLTACALREVREETGYHCRLVSFVGTTEYHDRKDRNKIVAYWAMVPEHGAFQPGEEVDDLRWVSLADAPEVLTYERDRELVTSWEEPSAWMFQHLRRSA